MAGLLTGGIANIVNSALSGIMYDVSVSRKTTDLSTEPWKAEPSAFQVCGFKGFAASYKDRDIDGERIMIKDKRVIVLAKSATVAGFVPKIGDTVTCQGVVGVLVSPVDIDPATATYSMQVRT